MSDTRPSPPHVVLDWDLSRSQRIADVGWRHDAPGREQFWKGDIDLTLKLPQGALVSRLADVAAERKGDALYILRLRGHAQTLSEVFTEVERRIVEFELPRRDLDEWRADVGSGDFRKDRVFATRRNDLTPALSLEVKHSYDDVRPWYLSWEIAWPAVAEPAPPSPGRR